MRLPRSLLMLAVVLVAATGATACGDEPSTAGAAEGELTARFKESGFRLASVTCKEPTETGAPIPCTGIDGNEVELKIEGTFADGDGKGEFSFKIVRQTSPPADGG